jgi:hypothetical protein
VGVLLQSTRYYEHNKVCSKCEGFVQVEMRQWEYYYKALGTMNITKFAANVKVLCTLKGGNRSSTAMKHIQNEFALQKWHKGCEP